MTKVRASGNTIIYMKETREEFEKTPKMETIKTYKDEEFKEYNRLHFQWALDISEDEKKRGKK